MSETRSSVWKDWRIWVAVCLVLAVVASFAFKGPISVTDVLNSLRAFTPRALFLAACLCTLQVFGMGLRLKALAPKGTKLIPILWAVAYGQFANAFFPARAGDALKIAILTDKKKGAGLPFTTATGILVADRPIDIGALVLWIALSGSYAVEAFQSEKMPSFGTVFLSLSVGILLLALTFNFLIKNRFPSLRKKLGEFGRSAGSFLNFRYGLPALLFGIGTWLCEYCTLLVLVHSIGFPLAFSEAVAVIVLLNLAIALPISVANVGPFEAAMTYALSKLGLPAATALSVAILHHAFQVLGTCLATLLLVGVKSVQNRSTDL